MNHLKRIFGCWITARFRNVFIWMVFVGEWIVAISRMKKIMSMLQTVRHPKTHLNVWSVVAKRRNTFSVWFKMRLKGHVISFQTHYRSIEMNAWLWIYGTFSKIPRLINTHHGKVPYCILRLIWGRWTHF